MPIGTAIGRIVAFADRLIRSTRFNAIQPDSPRVSTNFGGNHSGNADLGISRLSFRISHLRAPFPRKRDPETFVIEVDSCFRGNDGLKETIC